MFIAGVLSGLLGIGSGAVKVLAMDHAMKLPFKVSTTTSNFMIGVTAAACAGTYLAVDTLRRGWRRRSCLECSPARSAEHACWSGSVYPFSGWSSPWSSLHWASK